MTTRAAPWARVIGVAERLRGRMGVAWGDLGSGERFDHNSDERFPAASIIKLHILVELFKQADRDLLSLEEELIVEEGDKVGGAGVLSTLHTGLRLPLSDLAALMIVVSDNTASNMILDRVGLESVNRLAEELGLSGTVLRRTFMTHPDLPTVNFVTARDTLVLLESLYHGRLLSPARTAEALEILKRQQFREKIPRWLPKEVPCAHKTGEISGVRHDAGIVFAPGGPYALVALTRDLAEEEAGDMAIAEVSRRIYHHIASRERVR